MNFSKKEIRKQGRKREEENERKREKKREREEKTAQLFSLDKEKKPSS